MRAPAPFLPHKLDIKAFIESGEDLSGQADLSVWVRVAASLAEGVNPSQVAPLKWLARGRQVPRRVGGPELWLDIEVQGALPLTCQRCLHPVVCPIDLQRSIQFVGDENAAAQLDADLDDDVLALSRHFDLLALLEDEVIMDSPIVPRHDVCPEDVDSWMRNEAEVTPDGDVLSPESAVEDTERQPHPFAALAALKKKD